ncbi:aldo/keto reductase [Ectobacillus polymachus]|uniref:aldo/keto reductase n=1 Tax=Ectobacillus polymachus TaxID=1508806 RepID=UPI003A87C4D2
MSKAPSFILNNGLSMPALGLGVYKIEEGNQTVEAVKEALRIGYRLIDTASLYANETGVGTAIKESGVKREDLFLTTKVWNTDQGYESTLKAFEESLTKLQTDYLDLYLIHWAVKGKYMETWRALEHLYDQGKVKAIGVCNFNIHHLRDLEGEKYVPAVNQVELHPLFNQRELRTYCKEKGIQVEAWGPILRGKDALQHPVFREIGDKYGKTPAQVILRWHYQNEVIAIPKSVHAARIQENFTIFDFALSEEDMKKIDALEAGVRFGKDPDQF